MPTVVAAQNRFKQGGRGGQQQQGQQQGFGGYNQQQGNDPNEFYGVLNIPMNASQKDIKSAYRKLALKFHVSTTYEVSGISCDLSSRCCVADISLTMVVQSHIVNPT